MSTPKKSGSKNTKKAAVRKAPAKKAPVDVNAADEAPATFPQPVVEDTEAQTHAGVVEDPGTEEQPEDTMAVDVPVEELASVPSGAKTARIRASAGTRDSRLPSPGSPITKVWKGRIVTAIEQPDGSFSVEIDGTEIGLATSLSKAAQIALLTRGLVSPVNGFGWFGLIPRDHQPRKATGKSVAVLTVHVQRLQARLEKAQVRVTKSQTALDAARQTLLEATQTARTDN